MLIEFKQVTFAKEVLLGDYFASAADVEFAFVEILVELDYFVLNFVIIKYNKCSNDWKLLDVCYVVHLYESLALKLSLSVINLSVKVL